MILAFPAFDRIRAAHPSARITLLTTAPFEALARAGPWFDAVDADGRPRGVRDLAALVARLRRARYDRVYDLQAVDRTNLYFQLLRPFPPAWSGTAWGCGLPHRNPGRMRLHTLERQAEQLDHAGLPPAPTARPDVGWLIRQAPAGDAPEAPAGPRGTALLVPGASPARPRKRWPADRYAALARDLAGAGLTVFVLGAAGEREIGAAIASAAPGTRDLTGRTSLAQVARLGSTAALAVGNDTGPMHLLAAAGAPCVSLFSDDSDPDLCAPRGRVTILRREDLADLPVADVRDAALAMTVRPTP